MQTPKLEIDLLKESCAKTIVLFDLYMQATADSDLPTIEVAPLYFVLNLMLIELCEDEPNIELVKTLIEKDNKERKKLDPVFDDIMEVAKKYAKRNGLNDVSNYFSPN